MEKYKDMGSNIFIIYYASDVTDVTNATTGKKKQEIGRQSLEIMGQLKLETKKNNLRSLKVFKAISGNAVKPWKMRQKTRMIIRAEKLAGAAIKEIAIQKFRVKKEKMQR